MENGEEYSTDVQSHSVEVTSESEKKREFDIDRRGFDLMENREQYTTEVQSRSVEVAEDGKKQSELDIDAGGFDLTETSSVPVITYNINDGHQLLFFEIVGSDGQRAYPVLEQTASGRLPLTATPRLANESPLEFFNAVARPDDPLPEILKDQFGDSPRLGPRGWLLPVSERAAGASANLCDPHVFANHIESYNFQKRLIRTKESPLEHPSRWDSYHDCLGIYGAACYYQWYRYTARLYNVDLFYSMVSVCGLDHHPTFITNYGNTRKHVGPEIYFSYRDTNNYPGTAYTYDFKSVGETRSWLFHTGNDWDWFVRIKLARSNDRFNIGLTWSRF